MTHVQTCAGIMELLQSKIVVHGLVYPEGIRWHQGRIWFSDVLDCKVYTYDPKTCRTEMIVQTQDLPSGLGFLSDGRLLIATMKERQLLRLDADGLKTVADLRPHCDLLNDMVVDSRGRAYVDSCFANRPMSCGIIMVEPDGDYRLVADNLRAPNGLAIAADGKTLVVSEFLGNSILAFDITSDGGLTNRRSFADLGSQSADGICMDENGAAWAGLPYQGKFRRFEEGGDATHEISLVNKWAIAPVLGGSDRRTLFLCTAEVSMDTLRRLMEDPRDARQECRGWIEAVEGISTRGAGWP